MINNLNMDDSPIFPFHLFICKDCHRPFYQQIDTEDESDPAFMNPAFVTSIEDEQKIIKCPWCLIVSQKEEIHRLTESIATNNTASANIKDEVKKEVTRLMKRINPNVEHLLRISSNVPDSILKLQLERILPNDCFSDGPEFGIDYWTTLSIAYADMVSHYKKELPENLNSTWITDLEEESKKLFALIISEKVSKDN